MGGDEEECQYFTFVRNLQGDVLGILGKTLDNAGVLRVDYLYDLWGRSLRSLTTAYDESAAILAELNPFRYRGYLYDEETGLYYLRTRYYNPTWGRFMNADSLLGKTGALLSHNLFAYCKNRPAMLVDPSGTAPARSGYDEWIYQRQQANRSVWQKIGDAITGFFSPSTNTINGQFREGIIQGSGSLTGGYSEVNGRVQVDSNDGKNRGMLGVFGKVSGGNASGEVGIGNDDVALSVKGVGDGLTATAQGGIQYKDGVGLAAKAKAAVLSGRATVEFELFGWQIELGASGDVLSVGGEARIGIFPDEGFVTEVNVAAGLVGGGYIFRVKPVQ